MTTKNARVHTQEAVKIVSVFSTPLNITIHAKLIPLIKTDLEIDALKCCYVVNNRSRALNAFKKSNSGITSMNKLIIKVRQGSSPVISTGLCRPNKPAFRPIISVSLLAKWQKNTMYFDFRIKSGINLKFDGWQYA